MLSKAYLDGFFCKRYLAVVEVMVNDVFEVLRIKEIDIICLQHRLKLRDWLVWSFVGIKRHRNLLG